MEEIPKKPKKKPSKIEDLTKEQIRQAIIKKRECNAKAQQIVESLLENCINEDYFLKCIPDINQSHLEDIIEERSILHLCGYPLCNKIVSQNEIPKQQYRISIKTNKVYDITARKSFCSNSCYKSAMHIKKQMLTSPLWFREYEEVPKFYLIPLDSVGSLGQEVDLGINRINKDLNSNSKKQFTTIKDFTSASLKDMDGTQVDVMTKQVDNNTTHTHSNNQLILKSNDSNVGTRTEEPCIKTEHLHCNEANSEKCLQDSKITQPHNIQAPVQSNAEVKTKSTKKISNPLNIVGEIIEKPEKKIDPILLYNPETETEKKPVGTKKKTSKKDTLRKKEHIITPIIVEVEKCLAEWFTIDTLIFLFGQNKVKDMVANKGESLKDYLNNYTKSVVYNSNMYDQYQALCRKLNILEVEDRRSDTQVLNKETKPLPSYSMLKEESKKMQLKVKAFYSGETEIPETVETETNEEDTSPHLPLVDKMAQNALRRKIVCQHLNKVLPDLLKSLGLLKMSVSSDVRLLVNTFKLKANNIMFKPIQWTLIALIFIKLLSLRDSRLKDLLEQPTAFNHMQLLLLSYQQEGGYLDRLIVWLTDVDRLLDINDLQFTIE